MRSLNIQNICCAEEYPFVCLHSLDSVKLYSNKAAFGRQLKVSVSELALETVY